MTNETTELSPVAETPASISSLAEQPADDIAALADRLRSELSGGYLWFARWRSEREGEQLSPERYRELVKLVPGTSLSWDDLGRVSEADADEGAQLWVRIREEARTELRSGHLAARAVECTLDRPMDRARFMEIRRALMHDWHPQTGIENILIDQMAQAYSQQLFWTEEFSKRSRETMADISGVIAYGRDQDRTSWSNTKYPYHWGSWAGPLQREADAIDQAFQMADKWNRVFLRVLRQLRDLRRYTPPVIVNNGGQVNIGQQQVNRAEAPPQKAPRRAVKRRRVVRRAAA